jgi:hypothetical protein
MDKLVLVIRKRYLSENMCVRDADVQKINHIMDKIKYNNVETRVG